jgi:stress response protein YsnF
VHDRAGRAEEVARVEVREERVDVERGEGELEDAVLVAGREDDDLRGVGEL